MKRSYSTTMKKYPNLKNHVGILNHGSLIEFQLMTPWAVEWWEENGETPPDWSRGVNENNHKTFFVEHRYATPIYEAMLEEI